MTQDAVKALGLIDEKELADALGLTVATLSQWRSKGVGPAYVRYFRHVRYRQADVEAWLNKNTVRPRCDFE